MPDNKRALSELLGDLVIFRDLNPVDPRLPQFDNAWTDMGLNGPARPRKHEPAYAQAVAWLLRHARKLDNPDADLVEIFYMGDTALSDGNAFRNLRTAGGWQGWAFIGAERDQELSITEEDGVFVCNRWSGLANLLNSLRHSGARLDDCTAVIVDIDKTALGARGRNDRSIDQARTTAMQSMIAETLGRAFNPELFQHTYTALNIARYHPFTADNQDYLAYICLMVNAGVYSLENLLGSLASGRLVTFLDFLDAVDELRARLSPLAVCAVHEEVLARVRAGDATPFKAFRRREYLETVSRMGHLPDDASPAQRLSGEICLTREVLDALAWLQSRGCLLLGLSDKPDEASLPTPELAAVGYQPLHRAPTHVVGPSIADLLP